MGNNQQGEILLQGNVGIRHKVHSRALNDDAHATVRRAFDGN
jgi:hypothetical protein